MSLEIYTARIDYQCPDALNITRQKGSRLGLVFAPSWKILTPVINARRRIERFIEKGDIRSAAHEEKEAWEEYVPLFHAEMQESFRKDRRGWDMVLDRPRVVLTCFCPVSPVDGMLRCHRLLVAGYLEKAGVKKMGAVNRGEIARAA